MASINKAMDNIRAKINKGVDEGLEEAGQVLVRNAQSQLYPGHGYDTGELSESIKYEKHKESRSVDVYSDSEYAPFVEYGTGIFIQGGRQTAWHWQDRFGQWHTTQGQQGLHFMENAKNMTDVSGIVNAAIRRQF